MRKVSFFVAVMLVVVSTVAMAQEYEGYSKPLRSGFTVGIGLGPAANTTIPQGSGLQGIFGTSTNFAVMSDFYAGGFLTPQLGLFFNNKVSWFSYAGEVYTASVSGLAFAYYFSPSYPSAVIGAGVGLALFDSVFVYTNSFGVGPGVYVTAGYEFYKWLSVQATFLYSAAFDNNLTWHNLTPTVELLFMWY